MRFLAEPYIQLSDALMFVKLLKNSQAAELRFSELQNVKVSLADKQNFVAFSENGKKKRN